MNCKEFKELSLGFSKKPLTEGLSLHLEDCRDCSAEWAEFTRVLQLIDQVDDKRPSLSASFKILQLSRQRPVTFKQKVLHYLRPIKTHFKWNLAPVMMAAFFLVSTAFLIKSQISPEIAQKTEALEQGIFSKWTASPLVKKVSRGGFDDSQTYGFQHEPQIPSIEESFQKRQAALRERDADQLLMRGRRLKSTGRIDLALRDFETIYRYYPEYTYMSDVLLYKAQCYTFLGENQKALDVLSILTEKFPSKEHIVTPLVQQLEQQN